MLGPRVPRSSGTPNGRGLALVRMGGEGAHGDGGRNMMGDGELSLGCILGGLYGLNRFGWWPDILSQARSTQFPPKLDFDFVFFKFCQFFIIYHCHKTRIL